MPMGRAATCPFRGLRFLHLCPITFLLVMAACVPAMAAEPDRAGDFRKHVQPILTEFCYQCHDADSKKGGVALDKFASDNALLENRELWYKALKMLRAGMMPPRNKPKPSAEQTEQIIDWIKSAVFK